MTTARHLAARGCAASLACAALALPRSIYYRSLRPRKPRADRIARRPPNKLSKGEVQAIKDVLHEEGFIDLPPREIVPTLADEGRYLGSIRTFYRVLAGGTMELIRHLGLERSFSRPRTSDDNPYSESQFRTFKHHSRFPAFFESATDAEGFLTLWFKWYNDDHRHTGLNLHTPASVHHGDVEDVVTLRRKVMDEAFARNPNRFPNGRPSVLSNPPVVGINLMYRSRPVLVESGRSSEPAVAGSREGIYTNYYRSLSH